MSEAIVVALISAAVSLIGIWMSNRSTASKIQQELRDNQLKTKAELEKHQAVTDVKIDELTREVRAHNNFAQRIPVLETRIENLERR